MEVPSSAGDDREQEANLVALKERRESEGECSSAGEEQEESPGQGAQPEDQDGEGGHILALVSRCPETQEPEEAILMEEHIESEVSPLVDSPKTEKAIRHFNGDTFHGDLEDWNEDPMQTVDIVAQTGTVKREETDLEFKGPAEPSSLEPTAPDGRASDRQAVTNDDPALHGTVNDVAPSDQGSPPYSDPHDAAQTPAEAQAADKGGSEPGLPDGGHHVTKGPAHENQTEEAHPPEGRGNQKQVTFILEPEFINDSILSESSTSCQSQAESSFSGEMNVFA